MKRQSVPVQIFFKDTDRIPELPLGHTTAYQLAGQSPEYHRPHKPRVDSDHLHGCRIVRQLPITGEDIAAARSLLTSIETYGHRGAAARCYAPGFAFTFGEGSAAVDVLVCLQCRWVVFHFGGQSVSLVPSDDGLARLRELYKTLIEKGQPLS